jgi:hypothetical protein
MINFPPSLKSLADKYAPFGYEDAKGFHFGEAITVHWFRQDTGLWMLRSSGAESGSEAGGTSSTAKTPPMHGNG